MLVDRAITLVSLVLDVISTPVYIFTSYVFEIFRIILTYFGDLSILIFIIYWIYRTNPGRFRYDYSRLLHATSQKTRLSASTIRQLFTDTEWVNNKEVTNHTHGKAAAVRNTAGYFADKFAAILGTVTYFVQRSRSDERVGRYGTRTYYWSKDLNAQPAMDPVPDEALMVYVDVDYYMDMRRELSTYNAPTLIFTFQPTQVAKVTDNYAYTFNEENEVKYSVTGGAVYRHQVWNYSTDNLLVTRTLADVVNDYYTLPIGVSTLLGWIPISTTAYLVDRKGCDDDHEAILLTPVGRWNTLWAWLTGKLDGERLRRFKMNFGGFLRLQIFSQTGYKVSTGMVNQYAQATIPVTVDDTIASVARLSTLDLTIPQVLGYVDGDREQAAVLAEYHRSLVATKPMVVYPVSSAIRKYQFNPMRYDPDAKPSVVAFMAPFCTGVYAPDVCLNNEQQCVRARVEDIRSDVIVTPTTARYMVEFAELFISTPRIGHPVDVDEVFERQARPAQRRILENATISFPNRVIQMFMKKETYADPKDPRAISTFNGTDKLCYSRYIYAFAEHLKQQQWYAFGKCPRQVAEDVSNIAQKAVTNAGLTDCSRMDGRVSQAIREFELLLLLRYFHSQYHQEITDLHRAHYNLKAFGTFGTFYDSMFSRGSGGADTAFFNSILSKFIDYIHCRLNGMIPLDSYMHKGIFGGDDGFSIDVVSKHYEVAAAMVGQKIVIDVVQKGQAGIKFLARYYSPYVWYGDTSSCCDISRQLRKLHVTGQLPGNITPLDKLKEKARAYLLTDRYTPFIGPYFTCVEQFYGDVLPVNGKDIAGPPVRRLNIDLKYPPTARMWGSDVDEKDQYPNVPGDWMVHLAMQQMPGINFALFLDYIKDVGVRGPQLLLTPPLLYDEPIKSGSSPVVVNDDVLPHKVSNADIPPPLKGQKGPVKVKTDSPLVCRFGEKCKFKHMPRGCKFLHVPETKVVSTSSSVVACKYGQKCTHAGCKFLHVGTLLDFLNDVWYIALLAPLLEETLKIFASCFLPKWCFCYIFCCVEVMLKLHGIPGYELWMYFCYGTFFMHMATGFIGFENSLILHVLFNSFWVIWGNIETYKLAIVQAAGALPLVRYCYFCGDLGVLYRCGQGLIYVCVPCAWVRALTRTVINLVTINNKMSPLRKAVANGVVTMLSGAQQVAKKKKKKKTKRRPRNQVFLDTSGNTPTVRRRTTQPAAYSLASIPHLGLGLDNLRNVPMSYQLGSIYWGNGTIGANGSAYIIAAGNTIYYLTNSVPIAFCDPIIGAGYLFDIMKHYSRKVVKKLYLRFNPIYTSTANNAVIFVAPTRSGTDAVLCYALTSGTGAPNAVSTTMAMGGVQSFAAWERLEMDITGYIAGGTGRDQNEFSINATTTISANASFVNATLPGLGIVPACFYLSGTSPTFNGSAGGISSHYITVHAVVDLLDWRGSETNPSPQLLTPSSPSPDYVSLKAPSISRSHK